MEFLLFWVASIVIAFFLIFIIFQLDERCTYGDTRRIVEEWWFWYLFFIVVPILNLLMCIVTIILFICIFNTNNSLDGESVLKKIFFIKDDNN